MYKAKAPFPPNRGSRDHLVLSALDRASARIAVRDDSTARASRKRCDGSASASAIADGP